MTSDKWKKSKLGEVINLRRGHDLPKTKMKDGKIPVVGSNGIIGYHDEFTTESPCITVGRSGNVGKPYYLEEKCWAHNTTLYIDDFKGNNPQFVFYLLQTLNLGFYAGGSAVPTLNRNHIHPIEVLVPEVEEQKSIAKILSSIDKRIETNNQINKTLEEMAAAIFKHWFVDFEFPNENGEPYRSSGGEMIESEMGLIPKGWEVGLLSDLVEFRYGKDHKKLKDGNIPVYGSGGIMRNVDTALYKSESVLVPRKGTLNNVMYTNHPFWSVDTMFYSEMKKKDIAKYIYFFLKTKDLASMNTGSAVPSMTTAVLNSMPILIESLEIINSFNQILSPIFNQISLNTEESTKLLQMRDILLPKLMSGEIRIPVEV